MIELKCGCCKNFCENSEGNFNKSSYCVLHHKVISNKTDRCESFSFDLKLIADTINKLESIILDKTI